MKLFLVTFIIIHINDFNILFYDTHNNTFNITFNITNITIGKRTNIII